MKIKLEMLLDQCLIFGKLVYNLLFGWICVMQYESLIFFIIPRRDCKFEMCLSIKIVRIEV